MKQIVILFLLMIFGKDVFAQVSVGWTSEKDTFDLGELVTLTFKLNGNISDIESIDFGPLLKSENLLYEYDSISYEQYFDLSIINGEELGINNQKTKLTTNEIKQQSGTIKISVYSFSIGPLNNPIVKLKNGARVMYLESPNLVVLPPEALLQQNGEFELVDIKPIIKEGTHWTDFLVYLYGLLGALALFFIGKYIYSYKKDEEELEFEEEEEVVVIPAHIIALKELEDLQKKQLWQSGAVKQYQSQLTKIMRTYITGRYEIPALEMTTTELKKKMSKMKLSTEQISKMSDILQIADKVKFAKGTAGPEINERFMDYAKEWVQETKKEEPITE